MVRKSSRGAAIPRIYEGRGYRLGTQVSIKSNARIMNDTPTSRTNALLGKILYDCGVLDEDTAPEEWVQLARQLESELADWMQHAAQYAAERESNAMQALAFKAERDEAREYADRLAEGLPDGMLPKDVEVLRQANLDLAMELTEAREIIAAALKALPVGYLPAHTPESIPGRIEDLCKTIVDAERELVEAQEQRDTLAQALRECREDSVELLGERDWWQNETRLDYQKRYQETRENVTRADEALATLNRTL
jgi:hypothetical protein